MIQRRSAVVLAGAALVLATASPASAAAPRRDVVQGSVLPGTFHPTAVGIPGAAADGAVDVTDNDGSRQRLTPQNLGLVDNGNGDRFGTAVATAELNGDNFVDLVISAPGAVGSTANATGVYILFGAGTGYDASRMVKLPEPASTPTAADEFGAALVLDDGPGGTQLWVGAPGTTVNGHAGAGAVHHYVISRAGTPSLVETVTQDSPLVAGAAEGGDRFGEVLGYAGLGVAVGVPHEDIGAATDAGEMVRLVTDPQTGRLTGTTSVWSQDTPGVPGTAEAGDRFGAAVAGDGRLVGVPGEDLGALRNAGLVQEFDYDLKASVSGEILRPGPAITQDTPAVKPAGTLVGTTAVPGTAEAGDEFGAAVATGTFNCTETLTAAIGSPGESIGNVAGAGSVTLWTPDNDNVPCPSVVAHQGTTFSGVAERGDRVGAALAEVNGDPDADEDSFNTLLVGVPGEDIGSTPDVGREIVWAPLNRRTAVFGPISGDVKNQDFGQVLSLDGPSYSIRQAP